MRRRSLQNLYVPRLFRLRSIPRRRVIFPLLNRWEISLNNRLSHSSYSLDRFHSCSYLIISWWSYNLRPRLLRLRLLLNLDFMWNNPLLPDDLLAQQRSWRYLLFRFFFLLFRWPFRSRTLLRRSSALKRIIRLKPFNRWNSRLLGKQLIPCIKIYRFRFRLMLLFHLSLSTALCICFSKQVLAFLDAFRIAFFLKETVFCSEWNSLLQRVF